MSEGFTAARPAGVPFKNEPEPSDPETLKESERIKQPTKSLGQPAAVLKTCVRELEKLPPGYRQLVVEMLHAVYG
jgi:hypothetical protein